MDFTNLEFLRCLNANPLSWLLEEDPANPGVRYFTLRDILDLPDDDPQVTTARNAVMASGPVPAILAAQSLEGWWAKPGPGVYPKYTSSGWTIVQLAMLGVDPQDERLQRGADYVLSHSRSAYGGFSYDSKPGTMLQCWQGLLCSALIELGFLDDPRLQEAIDWLARSVNGEGIAPAEEIKAPRRYYRTGNSGPGFACAANLHKPCAWGAVKTLLALGKVPKARRDPIIEAALAAGVEFIFTVDPATAAYPTPLNTPPSRSWFQFGWPAGYVTDVLQILEALTILGYAQDSRAQHALQMLLSKQDPQGRWKMEYTYNGKLWADIEQKWQPSKWVTLRALRVLKTASG